ncbi:MAG: DUF4974 domain-containing protein [Muribaculaceae bacterium]|nr:DUF4974 domain-containing protein [Muribaculaceae bacterium]
MKLRNENFDSEVEFVARYWRQDAFEPQQAMERAGLIKPVQKVGIRLRRLINSGHSGQQRIWTAAASAGVVLIAAATGLYLGLRPSDPVVDTPKSVNETVEQVSTQQPQRMQVKRIEFEDASLAEVVTAIENTYGVKLGNVPTSSTQHITMSYSGTADDVVEAINEIFGLHITVEDQ